jgi:signal transduction histidine kinase
LIEDAGKGIPLEKQENIFVLFGNLNKSSDYSNTGVGLGLTYCKMVIEHMGGEIECNSQLGKGTLINFNINIGSRKGDEGLSESEQ